MKRIFNVRHTEKKCGAVPIDQALEKRMGGVIGFTKQKDTVAKWNLIKHQDAQFFKTPKVACG